MKKLVMVVALLVLTVSASANDLCEGEIDFGCKATQERFYSTYFFDDGSIRYHTSSNRNCPCIVSFSYYCPGSGSCMARDACLATAMCTPITPGEPIEP